MDDSSLAAEEAALSRTYEVMAPSPDRYTNGACHTHATEKGSKEIEVLSCLDGVLNETGTKCRIQNYYGDYHYYNAGSFYAGSCGGCPPEHYDYQ